MLRGGGINCACENQKSSMCRPCPVGQSQRSPPLFALLHGLSFVIVWVTGAPGRPSIRQFHVLGDSVAVLGRASGFRIDGRGRWRFLFPVL